MIHKHTGRWTPRRGSSVVTWKYCHSKLVSTLSMLLSSVLSWTGQRWMVVHQGDCSAVWSVSWVLLCNTPHHTTHTTILHHNLLNTYIFFEAVYLWNTYIFFGRSFQGRYQSILLLLTCRQTSHRHIFPSQTLHLLPVVPAHLHFVGDTRTVLDTWGRRKKL